MKAQNAIVKKDKKPFSEIITGAGAQKLIRASLQTENAVKRFTGTLINVVNSSEQLSNCDPGSVISAALRGEGMGLIYGHGYHVVPYGKKATFIPSYKGYIQLALATGLYADIDCIEVREGERRGRDRRTGRPIVDMSVYDTDEERDQHPIIGYKGYFELKDGYYREEYWTIDQLLRHADRYSSAFSLDLYKKWQGGENLTNDERRVVTDGSPWYSDTDKMMRKTVLRSLLTSGYAPLSNEMKSFMDNESESGEGDIDDLTAGIIPDYTIEASEPAENGAEASESVSDAKQGNDKSKAKKDGEEAPADYETSFFDEGEEA